jgi:hypothetical protein
MTEQDRERVLMATVERLCDCIAEAVTWATLTDPKGHHNAGMWDVARREARALLETLSDADGEPDPRLLVLARSVRRLLYREALDASPEDRADLDARIDELDKLWSWRLAGEA